MQVLLVTHTTVFILRPCRSISCLATFAFLSIYGKINLELLSLFVFKTLCRFYTKGTDIKGNLQYSITLTLLLVKLKHVS